MWNAANLFTGWVDVPLSNQGIDEAIAAGKQIADLDINVIFTSTLMRAQQTAMLAMAQSSSGRVPMMLHEAPKQQEWSKIYSDAVLQGMIPTYKNAALNERYYGGLQGCNKDEMREKYGADQVKIWRRSFDVPPPDGESLKMTAERTLPYFDTKIIPKLEARQNVLVAAHGNSLRSIIMSIEGMTPEEILAFELATGVPRVYEYSGGSFSLDGN